MLNKIAAACALTGCLLASTDKVSATKKFGYAVEQHVKGIFDNGYALEMSKDDFFHGHLFIDKNAGLSYDSPNNFLAAVRMILYHTDELPIMHTEAHRNKPRSILGMMDGTVMPASEKIDVSKLIDQDNYKNHGSISANDIPNQYPGLMHSNEKAMDPEVSFSGRKLLLNYQFDLVQTPIGCFNAAGRRFDILLDFDNQKGWISYKAIDCNQPIRPHEKKEKSYLERFGSIMNSSMRSFWRPRLR